MYIQTSIGSRNSAIQHAYHTLLHPSSSSQPRHPMLKIVWALLMETTSFEHQAAASARDAQRCCHEPRWSTQLEQHIALVSFVNRSCSHERLHGRCPMQHISANVFTAPIHTLVIRWCANDPSAGSPTETLLRLLLPLSDKVH